MKSMADVWKQMEKQHGEEGLFAADAEITAKVDVIPTGSYALDDALGIWGALRGHINQFCGFESSGKTLMSLSTIAQWQKQNPANWALFIDAEYTFDSKWAEQLGVDLSRLMVYKENSATKIFERLVGQPNKDGKGKKAKLGLLDMEAECSSGLGVIVLDSVAAIIPPVEATAEVGKQNMAALARFLPDALRRLTPAVADTNVAFILINQLRLKPGVLYGSPEDTVGGVALKHFSSTIVNFGRITGADSKIERGGDQVGHHIRAKIQKNKKAPPFKTAEFAIEYVRGVVQRGIEIRDLGAKYGVIKRPNNKSWELDGVSYNGKDAIANALEKNPELMSSVLDRIKENKANNFISEEIAANNQEETNVENNSE